MALPPGDDHAAVGVRFPAWERASHLSAGRDEPAASTSGTSLAVGGRDAVGATACTAVPAAASTAAGAVPATALAERAGGLRVRPAREQAVATRLLSPASTSAVADTRAPAQSTPRSSRTARLIRLAAGAAPAPPPHHAPPARPGGRA